MAFNPMMKSAKRAVGLAEEQPSDVRASLDRSAQLKSELEKMQGDLAALRAGQDKEQLAREEEIRKAEVSGDEATLVALDKRSISLAKKIENKLIAIEAQTRLIIEEEQARYALKAQHNLHLASKLTAKMLKRAARQQAAIIEYVDSTREMLDIGEEIGAMLLGLNLRVGDAGTSQQANAEFVGQEIGRLHQVDGVAYKLPLPGAIIKPYYGVPVNERRSLLQEYEVRAQHILASVKAGPHPKSAVSFRPSENTAAPLPVAAANLIPAEVQSLNGEVMPPDAPGVTLAQAMALSGGIKKQELTSGGKDPAANE